MKKTICNRTLLSMIPATLLMTGTNSAHANDLQAAFSDGSASLNARYRYESVDDSTNLDASASTLRTRLGFTTSAEHDLSAHIDFETISRVMGDPEYNSGSNGQTTYAKVIDPNGTELNQAYLKYMVTPELSVVAGRQRIIFDNARFVGNVGWRQNEQTYDAIRFGYQPSKDINLDLVNIQQVNTITAAEVESNHNLINAGISGLDNGKLSAYLYLLENDGAPNSATSTVGLSYKGAMDSILYTFEYAQQSDYADNTTSFDADYLLAMEGPFLPVTAESVAELTRINCLQQVDFCS